MTRWERLRKRIRSWWEKVRKWVVSVLVSLGLMTAAVLSAQSITYTAATTYEDGTDLPLSEIAETRLYCDGNLAITELGADGQFDPVLSAGDHTCYATHVATNGLESVPSNTIEYRVLPSVAPSPPDID